MSNLQAAVGVAQLERIDAGVRRKREIGRRYLDLLGGIPGVRWPLVKTDYAENIFWVFGLVLENEHPISHAAAGGTECPAELAMKCLADKGIGTRPFFWGMHEQPVFQKMGLFKGASCPVAEHLARCGLYIPTGLALTDSEVDTVAAACREVLS
jgi:perosamine synthetase